MKKLSFILGLGIFANYSAQTSLDTGLVRSYPFNGNANDIGPNAQHGFVNGATLTTDRFGNPNAAYNFDGVDDYILIYPYYNTNSYLTLNEYTYSAWALSQTIPAAGTQKFVVFIGDYLNNTGGQAISISNMGTMASNGWGGFSAYDSAGFLNRYVVYNNMSIAPNVWRHIVITRSTNVMNLYIDGVLTTIDSTNFPTIPFYGYVDAMLLDVSGSALIGVSHNYSGYFHGKIDDVRIYNRAISASEVNALYNLPTTLNSLRDFTVSKFNLSPNPASDKAQLNYNLPNTKNLVFNISNIQGQILKSEFLNSNQGAFQLDLTKFDNGVYFYTIVADGEIRATQKLVVTR